MFAGQRKGLSFTLQEGQEVVVKGTVEYMNGTAAISSMLERLQEKESVIFLPDMKSCARN